MLYMRERKGNMRMDNKYKGLLGDIITWAVDFDGTLREAIETALTALREKVERNSGKRLGVES